MVKKFRLNLVTWRVWGEFVRVSKNGTPGRHKKLVPFRLENTTETPTIAYTYIKECRISVRGETLYLTMLSAVTPTQ